MKKSISIFLSLLLFIATIGNAQTYSLRWANASWTAPTYSKTITNVGGSGVDATVSITNTSPAGNVSSSGASTNNAFQYNTPGVGAFGSINWYLPGATGYNPLVLWVDWNALTYTVVTKISFSRPVDAVSFYLGDMDRTNPLTYVDRVNVTGKKGNTTAPAPIITKYMPTLSGQDTVLISGNTAYGNAALSNGNAGTSSPLSQGSTIWIKYSNPIDTLTIVWDQGPGATGNPATQAIAMSDVAFSIAHPQYPPTADNFINNAMPQGNGPTAIPGLIASDLDGSIASYKILTLPAASEGLLSIPCPPTPSGATCTGGFASLTAAVLAANPGGIVLTPAQAAALRFDPAPGFVGNAQFTFNATDNHGLVSNTATYTQPVIALPPVSNNIMENSMPNTNGATAIQGLSSSDVDGTIAGYQITSLPSAAEGVLSIPCPPTPTGATCSGGYADLTAAVLAANPGGIPLTAAQMAAMRFDPTAGFTGNAVFQYNATDNSGYLSNTANYTIPVTATASIQRPPLAENIFAQPLNNSNGPTAIPSLAATDLDGTVASYTITSVPNASQGILSVACPPTPGGATCSGGFADLTAAVLAANGGNIVLTPAQISTLRFDPAPGFIGNVVFGYTATDNDGFVSNNASYTIPVVNTPPVASNINTMVPFNAAATAIPNLSASDADGSVVSYTIASLPTTAQGVLSIPCPPTPAGATCTGGYANLTAAVLAANPGGIVLTPAQAAALRFDPATGFSGTAPFTYFATDNSGLVSNTATYNITTAPQPPVTTDITNTVMPNTNGNTNINAFNGTDPDGTIANYLVLSVPDPAQGVLRVPCPPTPAGGTCTGGYVQLTQAVLNANVAGISLTPAQAAALQFNPTAGYTGQVKFEYAAFDNSGLQSNVSTYTIPVSGSGNIPPVAQNIIIPAMPNTNGATSIPSLIGTDADGTIASYTLKAVPAASEGVLSIPCPPTPTGATCSGGFANLTPAVLAANSNGINLTPAQAAAMRFDPAPGFSGNVAFVYVTTDNSGAVSAGAVYTIPVTSLPPVATAIVAPTMPQTNGPTTIPALIATDVDGSISSYQIESVPPVSQGVLSIPCPPTPAGATCSGGFANITAAVLAANPGGITLTAAQMAAMRFDPAPGYQGNVVFNYHATDNSGLISNTTTYTIPVSGMPPVSQDVIAPKMLNSNGPTAIPALNSMDPDGTIATYIINSLPPASQGVLSIPCPPTPAGATCSGGYANLTPAVLAANPGGIVLTASQMAGMQLDPSPTYSGDVIFNYAAYDNNGNLSNTATYTIPVGTLVTLPVAVLEFNAIRNGNDILVKWKTENEVNLSRFEVEYSTDAISFDNGGNVLARNNNSINQYGLTLINFTQPVYYIRLKSVDQNGNFKYSTVVTIRLNGKYVAALNVSPNPAVERVAVKITSPANTVANVQMVNTLGEVVYQQKQSLIKGDNIITIAGLQQKARGTYMIHALVDGQVLTQKLVLIP